MRARLALLAAAVLLAPASGAEETAAPAPRIRVEPESFDFGRTLPGKVLRKELTIRNFGEATLVIERVSTTCGCTAALAAESRVAPGGSTLLRITFETRSYSGRVERQVLVRSNDPKRPVVEVRLSAMVEASPAKTRAE